MAVKNEKLLLSRDFNKSHEGFMNIYKALFVSFIVFILIFILSMSIDSINNGEEKYFLYAFFAGFSALIATYIASRIFTAK